MSGDPPASQEGFGEGSGEGSGQRVGEGSGEDFEEGFEEGSGGGSGEPRIDVRDDPGAPGIEVQVAAAEMGELPVPRADLVALLERAVRRALTEGEVERYTPPEEGAVRRSEPGGQAVGGLSVALVDDEDIRRLNREHLGHDRVTDVIAFPLWERGEPVVGDVYVGLEQARRQAAAEGVPFEEELVRLVVHGTLHVLGWDHPEEASERGGSPMYRLQERIVRVVVQTGG